MMQVLSQAQAAEIPQVASKYESPDTHLLIKVCRELQRVSGEGAFFLSCRTAGRLLGMNHNKAWLRLGMLVADGVLQVRIRGTKKRATRYRYVGDSVKEVRGE